MYNFHNISNAVPPPLVTMLREPEGHVQLLSKQILSCMVEVSQGVDTTIVVTTKWTVPPSLQNDSRLNISVVEEQYPLYHSSVVIDAYNLYDSGNYTCSANVIPDLTLPGPIYESDWTTEVLEISACEF